jgi:hypothetical protein
MPVEARRIDREWEEIVPAVGAEASNRKPGSGTSIRPSRWRGRPRPAQQYRTGEAQYALEQPTPRRQLDLVVRQGQGGCGVDCFSATR